MALTQLAHSTLSVDAAEYEINWSSLGVSGYDDVWIIANLRNATGGSGNDNLEIAYGGAGTVNWASITHRPNDTFGAELGVVATGDNVYDYMMNAGNYNANAIGTVQIYVPNANNSGSNNFVSLRGGQTGGTGVGGESQFSIRLNGTAITFLKLRNAGGEDLKANSTITVWGVTASNYGTTSLS